MKRRAFLEGSLLVAATGLAASACKKPPRKPIDATHGGIPFKELVHVEPDDALPIVVAIHGNGGAPEHWVEPWSKFPGRARIVLPQGFEKFEEGYAWFAASKDFASEKLAADVSSAEERLWKGIAALAGGKRIVVAGYAEGATLAYLLALRHADAIAGAFPVAGALPTRLYPQEKGQEKPKSAPVTAFHGKLDEVIPVQAARDTIAAFTKQGLRATLKEYEGVRHRPSDELHADLDTAMLAAR
ncbi:MAG: dienelactone hydrolase family protein [Deltaproteobacteria bacterium]|nr:dienelactone hydrolase family protein [Deltaproteobacteria bacterium]